MSLGGDINSVGQHLGMCDYYVPRTYNCIDKITGIVSIVVFNSMYSSELCRPTKSSLYDLRLDLSVCSLFLNILYQYHLNVKTDLGVGHCSVKICIRTSYVVSAMLTQEDK